MQSLICLWEMCNLSKSELLLELTIPKDVQILLGNINSVFGMASLRVDFKCYHKEKWEKIRFYVH